MVLTTGTTCAHQEDAAWNEDMPLYHFIQEGSNIKDTSYSVPYSVSLYFAPTAVSALYGNVPDRRGQQPTHEFSLAP